MTITIVPEPDASGKSVFRAINGNREAIGPTVGSALDALTTELSESEESGISGTLVVVQQFRPDALFSEKQRERLSELMAEWREARDTQTAFPASAQAELEELVRAETLAMAERAKNLLDGRTK